jgi:hypothetical protein
VQCFNNATPPALLEANSVSVVDANRVEVTFVVPQSGTCVVNGAGGTGGGGSVPEGGTGVSAGPGLILSGGVVRVNAAAVRSYLTGSASLTHGTIPAGGGCASRTITVQGAVVGDKLAIGTPADLMTYSLALSYSVTAANTVTIRLCNYTASAITPPGWTWNVDVVKSF